MADNENESGYEVRRRLEELPREDAEWKAEAACGDLESGKVISVQRKGYRVIENTPGYLPESEPAEFSDWDSAISYAKELCSQLIEQGYKLDTENYNPPYWADFFLLQTQTDLGRVIEVTDIY